MAIGGHEPHFYVAVRQIIGQETDQISVDLAVHSSLTRVTMDCRCVALRVRRLLWWCLLRTSSLNKRETPALTNSSTSQSCLPPFSPNLDSDRYSGSDFPGSHIPAQHNEPSNETRSEENTLSNRLLPTGLRRLPYRPILDIPAQEYAIFRSAHEVHANPQATAMHLLRRSNHRWGRGINSARESSLFALWEKHKLL